MTAEEKATANFSLRADMSFILIVTLMVFLTVAEGISPGDHGEILRCRCISKEKKPIGRLIGKVEINCPSSHCSDVEIIATFKKTGQKICLDPDAPWVKKALGWKCVEQILSRTNANRSDR